MDETDDSRSARNPYQPPGSALGRSGKPSRGASKPGATLTSYLVECDCGQTIPVLASQAGSTTRCHCGNDVSVPTLGRLRESAGQDRYESSISDTIRRMIETGELPAGDKCAVSKKPTSEVIDLEILVPRVFRGQEDFDYKVAAVFGFLSALLIATFRRNEIVEEEASRIRIPILVARRYQAKVSGMGPARLKRLLGKIPIYAALFEENRDCVVRVPGFLD